MQYTVEVKNPCRCFFRSGMAERQSFTNAADAKAEAEAMMERMGKDFCKTHNFVLTQTGITYTISIVPSR
jgi:hypothetical protein